MRVGVCKNRDAQNLILLTTSTGEMNKVVLTLTLTLVRTPMAMALLMAAGGNCCWSGPAEYWDCGACLQQRQFMSSFFVCNIRHTKQQQH
jgi:hypothetical protein